MSDHKRRRSKGKALDQNCPSLCRCRRLFKGVVAAFSGFSPSSRAYLKELCCIVHAGGGAVCKEVGHQVTHVIAMGTGGVRAQVAQGMSVLCVQPNWIAHSWEQRHSADFRPQDISWISQFSVKISSRSKRRSHTPRKTAPHTRRRSGCKSIQKVLPSRGKQFNLRLEELVETERNFVSLMCFIRNYYIVPLREECNQGGLSATKNEIVRSIFGPLEDILSFHEKLLPFLEVASNPNKSLLELATFLSGNVERMKSLYEDYVNSFDQRRKDFERIMAKDKRLRHCVQAQKKIAQASTTSKDQSLKRQSLTDLLIAPVQRMPRYVLLIQALLGNLPADCEDFRHLRECLSLMKGINEYINTSKQQAVQYSRVMDISSSISQLPIDLVEKSSVFLEVDAVFLEECGGGRFELPARLVIFSTGLEIAARVGSPWSSVHMDFIGCHDIQHLLDVEAHLDGEGLPNLGVLCHSSGGVVGRFLLFSLPAAEKMVVQEHLVKMIQEGGVLPRLPESFVVHCRSDVLPIWVSCSIPENSIIRRWSKKAKALCSQSQTTAATPAEQHGEIVGTPCVSKMKKPSQGVIRRPSMYRLRTRQSMSRPGARTPVQSKQTKPLATSPPNTKKRKSFYRSARQKLDTTLIAGNERKGRRLSVAPLSSQPKEWRRRTVMATRGTTAV